MKKKRLSDLYLRLYPGRRADVLRLYAARPVDCDDADTLCDGGHRRSTAAVPLPCHLDVQLFDTYDLIRHMAAGEPKEDSLLVPGNYEEIKKLLPQHNRLIGWGLVGFGVWALYDTFISTWLYTLLCSLVGNGYAYDIITGIPNVVIAALLIFAGLKLLGLHPEKKNRDDELPPYPHE